MLPTYNEAENLRPFVTAVLPHLVASSHQARVLVVDDDSPDGTGRIADRLAADDEHVRVLHNGEKGGLGRAYLAGFRYALDHGADLILQMDADFSHDPAHVTRLLAAADEADLVIGSRYVTDGSVANWGILRRVLSRSGSLYARGLLDVPVRDLTGGFKCWHRRVLEEVLGDNVRANGYVFQIEMTYRAIRQGHRVLEVPICFRDRSCGTSKMTPGVALEALWKVPAVRFAGSRITGRTELPVLQPLRTAVRRARTVR